MFWRVESSHFSPELLSSADATERHVSVSALVVRTRLRFFRQRLYLSLCRDRVARAGQKERRYQITFTHFASFPFERTAEKMC